MIYNTIEELQKKVCEKVFEVYEVFQDFFGEEFVDLQHLPRPLLCLPPEIALAELENRDISDAQIESARQAVRSSIYPCIIVYWPEVTITNENNRSIKIQKLFAKIEVNLEGKIPYENLGFLLNRSKYPISQFMGGYDQRGFLHSHICQIPKNDLQEFQRPCLGRGPINGTILSLKREFDRITWMLFCQELSMYVTVESLDGVPYNKLEEIGQLKPNHHYQHFDKQYAFYRADTIDFDNDIYKAFVAYYLEHGHLNLCYTGGEYRLGMSYYDFIIDISNTFIEFVNSDPLFSGYNIDALFEEEEVLRKVVVADRKFYNTSATHSLTSLSRYIGREVLRFKGEIITLEIFEDADEEGPVPTTLLDAELAQIILQNILLVINYRYKNEYNYRKRGEEVPSPTYQNVRYL